MFDIARGTVAFAAASVAKTGDMKISTPTATLGIRGTTGLVEVPEGASASSANNVAIKLYPDADGKVGRIEVNDRAGVRLGFLSQGASGFTIRPGAGGRFGAVPLVISPQQALRDQGIVRQVHAAQSVGRQIVSQRQIRAAAGRPIPPESRFAQRSGASARRTAAERSVATAPASAAGTTRIAAQPGPRRCSGRPAERNDGAALPRRANRRHCSDNAVPATIPDRRPECRPKLP